MASLSKASLDFSKLLFFPLGSPNNSHITFT
jgi:hypothetical protein